MRRGLGEAKKEAFRLKWFGAAILVPGFFFFVVGMFWLGIAIVVPEISMVTGLADVALGLCFVTLGILVLRGARKIEKILSGSDEKTS